jgi:hypothetical protein
VAHPIDTPRVQQDVEVCKNILSAVNTHFKERKVIHIISLEFHIKGGDGTGSSFGIDQYLLVDSWTLPDYEMSYELGLLRDAKWAELLETREDMDDDDKQTSYDEQGLAETGAQMELDDGDKAAGSKSRILALIERKFFYAGGSARFFFDYTLIHLLDDVLNNLDSELRIGRTSRNCPLGAKRIRQ